MDFGPYLILASLEGSVTAAVLALTAVGLATRFVLGQRPSKNKVMTTSAERLLRKLPVIETVKEAYARVFGNLHLLVRASVLPFCLSLALIAFGFTVPIASTLGVLSAVLGLVPYTIFGVAWHRLTLLGPVAGAPPLVPGWMQRHWRFLGYLLAVMLIGYGAIAMVFSLALAVFQPDMEVLPAGLGLMIAAGAVILAFIMARLSFVFPAVSVDESYRLRHAWTHTKGQGLRLIGATLLAAAPMVALIWAVSGILGALLISAPAAVPGQDGLPPEARAQAFVDANLGALMLTQAVGAAINYVLMALMVSVISIAFRTCTGWVPAASGAVTPDGEKS